MRLRFVHTQSLLLFATVLVTVLCMGALNAWSLRNGFAEFLASRDVERLEQFAAFVADSAERAGGLEALGQQGTDLRSLLRQFARTPGGPQALGRQLAGPLPGLSRPPPQDQANAFRERVAIYTLSGQPVLGQRLAGGSGAYIERPVRVKGKVVAMARMVLVKPVQDAIEAKFLSSQYSNIALVALGLILCALATAHWVARRWVRPLLRVQAATQRIAGGDFAFRLQDTRTDEIGDVMHNIDHMASALQQMEGTRRQWIADISHELRTPLAVLRGEADALMDGIRPLTREAIASLREEILLLAALVDDLHFLAMADMKALPCQFEAFDVGTFAEKVVHRFELRSEQLGMKTTLRVTPEASARVRWDAKRMAQLLGNLLDNSLRYTDAPGQIQLHIQIEATQVVIDVDDTAPGVAASDLARVFEPLYRADAARSRVNGGSGLGLAICTAIVKAHRGSIEARPSPWGGLQVHVVLPRYLEEKP